MGLTVHELIRSSRRIGAAARGPWDVASERGEPVLARGTGRR